MNVMWPQEFFNRRYLEMFMTRSPEQLQFETDVIARYAGLEAGTSVADFCCGTGDLLKTMRERFDIQAQGVELVGDYANIATSQYGLKVLHGDAIAVRFDTAVDVALNWFSSFGYFDHEHNGALLENMARHVKPGGRLLMEGYNSTFILNHFKPVMTYERTWDDQVWLITRTSMLSDDRRQMFQTWKFECEKGIDSFNTCIELYRPDELRQLVVNAGFANIRLVTTPTMERPVFDELASDESPRILLIASKT